MPRRTAVRLLGSLVLVVVMLLVPRDGHPQADAQVSEALKVAAAVVSVPTPLTTAIAAAQSAYKLLTWGQEGNKVDVKFKLKSPIHVDLGMTYQVPFTMIYSFADTWWPNDYVFAELYIVADEAKVVYYKRIPESGYFENASAWFDDSSSGRVDGSIHMGAVSFDPSKPPQTLEAYAVLYGLDHIAIVDDHFKDRHASPSDKFVPGHGLNVPSTWAELQDAFGNPQGAGAMLAGALTRGLRVRAGPATDRIQIIVENPFYIGTPMRSDDGQTKNHPEEFRHDFTAVWDLAKDYGELNVRRTAQGIADVEVLGFEPADGWTFTVAPKTFRLLIPGTAGVDSKEVNVFGSHAGASPHPDPATYSTEWSVVASGTNTIPYEVPRSGGATALSGYTWETVFRVASDDERTLPATFTATDESPGLPLETPTPGGIDLRPPDVTRLSASLSVPVTTYTVEAIDPEGGELQYEWRMAGEACGTPRVPWTQTGQTVTWSHATEAPDSCGHVGTDHDVTLSVTVTSSATGLSVQCVVTGSNPFSNENPNCLPGE